MERQQVAASTVRIPGSLSLVLPVHDGSRDKSGEILARITAAHPRVKPVTHKVNRGYGAALTSGFRAATGDFVMFMDADRQFDIGDLGLLAPFVGRFDVVAGFRMERNDPLHRRIFAEIFN